MKRTSNAIIKQDNGWWIGWGQEIPGVNSQDKTRAELLKNLRSALEEALEFNRAIVNLSGRSNKDVAQVAANVKLQMLT